MSLNEIINPNVPLSCVFNVAYEQYAATTSTATATLSAASILGGLLVNTSSGDITLTTTTAALLLAALPEGARRSGVGIELLVSNTVAHTITIAGGTGVTITGLSVNPIAANTSRRLIFLCTNASTPTFSVYG